MEEGRKRLKRKEIKKRESSEKVRAGGEKSKCYMRCLEDCKDTERRERSGDKGEEQRRYEGGIRPYVTTREETRRANVICSGKIGRSRREGRQISQFKTREKSNVEGGGQM